MARTVVAPDRTADVEYVALSRPAAFCDRCEAIVNKGELVVRELGGKHVLCERCGFEVGALVELC